MDRSEPDAESEPGGAAVRRLLHDLNNALAIVVSQSQLALRRAAGDPEASADLTRIYDAAIRAAGVGRELARQAVDDAARAARTVDVDAETETGTAETEAETTPEPAPPRKEEPRARPGERVLVVDDEPALRTLIARVLESRGYEVLTAADGLEALSRLRAEPRPVHLLVTDVGLPGMNGWELAARVQSARPGTRVLYVTGRGAADRHPRLRETAPLLAKPFHVQELLARVRQALDAEDGGRPDDARATGS